MKNMTLDDKDLLLKDLCARLPYGVVADITCLEGSKTMAYDSVVETADIDMLLMSVEEIEKYHYSIKPHLRPMSSMTEEELKELNDKYGNIAYFFIQEPPYYHGLQAQHSDIGSIEISEFSEIYAWLNEHHFDYRGLIPMGLALEAPEGMYN